MEIRVLRYFLAVAREKNFTAASKLLHVTQPTLSKQLMGLEESLGKQLLIRGSRQVTLTEEGQLLKKRAEEIIDLADRTELEIKQSSQEIGGSIFLGGGESTTMTLLVRAIHRLKKQHPHIQYHLYSATAPEVMERIDRGLLDFGLVIGAVSTQDYDFRHLPAADRWGLLVRKDSVLAQLDYITAQHLTQIPLICSRQALGDNELSGWLGQELESLDIVATYNLLYNATIMVEEGIGHALCIDGLANTSEESPLTFIPLEPKMESPLTLIWKRHTQLTPASKKFLQALQEEIDNY
ncbi:LysR family transcriptional regulator [Aerococcaceae bacterium WGS1372]